MIHSVFPPSPRTSSSSRRAVGLPPSSTARLWWGYHRTRPRQPPADGCSACPHAPRMRTNTVLWLVRRHLLARCTCKSWSRQGSLPSVRRILEAGYQAITPSTATKSPRTVPTGYMAGVAGFVFGTATSTFSSASLAFEACSCGILTSAQLAGDTKDFPVRQSHGPRLLRKATCSSLPMSLSEL